MTEETKNLPVPVKIVDGSLVADDLDGLWRISGIYANSGLVPKEYIKKPDKVFVILATGLELGFGYMAALQSIGVINGKPGVYGDGIPGLVHSRKECEDWDEHYELDGKDLEHYDGEADLNKWPHGLKAVCILKRKGIKTPFKGFFSVADAIRQGSWNKPTDSGYTSVWQKYPLRMLKMRARAFAARDGFADHLKGLGVVEELRDIPQQDYEADAVVVETPISEKDAALALVDGQPVNSATDDPQTKEKPQETPLSKPESSDHILIAALINRGHDRGLIDAFIAMAADHNDSTVAKVMDEAFPMIDEFEASMRGWGVQFYADELSPEEPDSTLAEKVAENENKKSDVLEQAKEEGLELKPASELEETVEINPDTGKAFHGDEDWCAWFVDQYKNAKKTEFSPFVLRNLDGFAKLYKVAPTLYQKAKGKYKRFYPKDEWPVSASMKEGE